MKVSSRVLRGFGDSVSSPEIACAVLGVRAGGGVLRGGGGLCLVVGHQGVSAVVRDGWEGRGEGVKAIFHLQVLLLREHCQRPRIEYPGYLVQPCFCIIYVGLRVRGGKEKTGQP